LLHETDYDIGNLTYELCLSVRYRSSSTYARHDTIKGSGVTGPLILNLVFRRMSQDSFAIRTL